MTEKLKICLVGATGVGKTSLVARYTRSIFSEIYRTTIGVSIERRDVEHRGRTVSLVLWDLSGEDEFQSVQPAYLRGAAGYIIVVDGTRRDTADVAMALETRVRAAIGNVPFIAAINKADLALTWQLGGTLETLERKGWALVHTSAKTGAGVTELFERLVDAIYASRASVWI